MNEFTDRCIPQDDAAYWFRVQLQECDGLPRRALPALSP